MKIEKSDYEYLLKMARVGADEMCGKVYDISHNEIDRIETKYEERIP